MTSEIQNLLGLDYMNLLTSLIVLMAGFVALHTLLSKFSEATGIEFPWTRKEREQNERIGDLKTHVEEIDRTNRKQVEKLDALRDMVINL